MEGFTGEALPGVNLMITGLFSGTERNYALGNLQSLPLTKAKC